MMTKIALDDDADVEAGVTARGLNSSKRRHRKQQNMILGLIAVASFFILCSFAYIGGAANPPKMILN
eukprot:IDg19397t1